MTNTQNTNSTGAQAPRQTPDAEALADAILKLSGSNLKNYTMPSTRKAILSAAQKGIEDARSRLLAALRCALADLEGAKQAMDSGDIHSHNWEAHQLSIDEARSAIAEATDDSVGRWAELFVFLRRITVGFLYHPCFKGRGDRYTQYIVQVVAACRWIPLPQLLDQPQLKIQ